MSEATGTMNVWKLRPQFNARWIKTDEEVEMLINGYSSLLRSAPSAALQQTNVNSSGSEGGGDDIAGSDSDSESDDNVLLSSLRVRNAEGQPKTAPGLFIFNAAFILPQQCCVYLAPTFHHSPLQALALRGGGRVRKAEDPPQTAPCVIRGSGCCVSLV